MKARCFVSTALLCLCAISARAQQIGVGNYSNSYSPSTLPNPMFNGGGSPLAAGSFSFPHKVLGPDSVLVVGCAMDLYPLQTVTHITYAGKPLTKAWEQRNAFLSGYPITQEWFLIGAPTGDSLITVTHGPTSTNGHGVACQAVDLFNVYQGVPGDPLSALDGNASHSGPKLGSGGAGTINCTMHVPTAGDVIVMFEYSTGYNFSSIFGAPFPLSYTTGRFAAPQNSLMVTPPLPVGITTEKWTVAGSALNLEFSVGGLTFKPGT